MLKLLLCAAAMLATAATAQVTPYKSSDATSITDPDKIICQREEKIGTRLGAKKVCLTAREWELRKNADREEAEDAQAGARMRDSMDPPDTIMDVPRP